ncbi:hypothetical protein J4050_05325 [Winogradskyella sp. DF17]|uniref:Esterase n=1 Tax=Winogradskyella pelagia TaxID=2819984 RepID=A0ABS3T089_9FLAO|nr:alpha/beta hydrolase-fold protein [Winogradskyella sp. DF17]MBO3116157.1 hypothetical protein [Winogradskyella sp. DF17]
MKKLFLLILLTFASILVAQEKKFEIKTNKYLLDSIYSSHIEDYRTLKIYLPKDYSETTKYPVIYTLDGEWMFEPTVQQSNVLMEFDVIPKTIVVGIFHKARNADLGLNWSTGEFEKGSRKFYKFLVEDAIPYINSNYSVSGFNTLVGHSNSASFSAKVITQSNQPFKGFVALSQNLFGNQLQEFAAWIKEPTENPIFYSVASGKRDATPRLESGLQLDSIFKVNKNLNIKTQHKLYDADHLGIVGHGLSNGIAHIFSEYQHYNDWNGKLIDSLVSKGISSIDFINNHSKKMQRIYGIDFQVNQDDLSLMQSMTRNDSDIEKVMNYEIELLGKSDHFYATYAQFYEYAKSYDNALKYWSIHLEMYYKQNTSFFYYRRPIDLLHKKMKQPKQAIAFAENWKTKAPEFSQSFNLKIAKIALESGLNKNSGLKAINEYISNYTDDDSTDLKTAKDIQRQFKQLN